MTSEGAGDDAAEARNALDRRQAVDRNPGTVSAATSTTRRRARSAARWTSPARTEVDAAVRAAAAAFPQWRDTSLVKRASVMFAFRELVREHAGRAGRADQRRARQGRLGRGRRGRARPRGRRVRVRHSAPAQGRRSRRTSRPAWTRTRSGSRSAWWPGITPFNFPAMVPMWMFPIAIACGNTFVLKPSEKDPSASIRLAELLAEAGLPDGVFNVVHGAQGRGRRAADPPGRRAPSASSGRRPSPVTSPSRRPRQASASRRSAGPRTTWWCCPTPTSTWPRTPAVSAGFGSAGERCMAISVLVAVDPIGDELVSKIRDRVGQPDGRPRRPPRFRDGPAGDQGAPGQGRLLPGRRRRGRRDAGGRRPHAPGDRRGRATASGSARACSTTSGPR